MPLAQTIIDNALVNIGVLRIGQTPSTVERTEGLATLNRLVDSWNTDGLLVPAIAQTSILLATSAQAYTIGPSGADLTATRPIKIQSGQSRQSDADGIYARPLDIISADDWRNIKDKSLKSNLPERLYYEATSPNGKIYLWPTPNATSTYLDLDVWVALSAWVDLGTTNVALYPGYERALTLALAVELQPRITGAVLSDQTMREYQESLSMVKQYNAAFRVPPQQEAAQ